MAIFNIYSFDLFDTLLLRPYTDPQEVWRVLEEREGVKGFAKARKKGDMLSYKVSEEEGKETSIEEAYALMPKKFRPMIQKEMELEREVLRANHEMLTLWDELGRKGKRRIIVSDMYLPQEFLEAVLTENGIEGWDAFYLSRTHNARKTTGRLFEIMLEEEGVKPSEVLHIGDNEWSDVKVPQQMGIATQHYRKVSERMFDICPFMHHIDGRLAGALAVGWHQYSWNKTDINYWHRLGFMMGGVLGYLYVSWLAMAAKELDINHLMFVARDGYIWQKICKVLYPEIKTDYFYAPRPTSIAVLGAIGNDPIAIADRKQYMEKHLQGVNPEDVRKKYSQYLEQFSIDERTALVDGCSSGFSAQRLVETALRHPLFTFYLMSMSKMHHAGALYQTDLYSLPFQNLSEFLFGAPENPIKDVSTEGPIYNESPSIEELFKTSVSESIGEGAVACACFLHRQGVKLTPDDWINYSSCFMNNLTEEDKNELDTAKNAGDVSQINFNPITWQTYKKIQLWVEKWGRATFYFYFVFFHYKMYLKIGRGIKFKIINMRYKTNIIVRKY